MKGFSVYSYTFEEIQDDWTNAIIFDLETVDTIDDLVKAKESQTYEYLDASKAKHVAFAIQKDVYIQRMSPPLNRLLKGLERRTFEDYYIYVVMNADAETISKLLFDVAKYLQTNFIAHNGKRFDFTIFRQKRIRFYKQNAFIYENKRYYRLIDTYEITRASLEQSLAQFGIVDEKRLNNDLKEYLVHDIELTIKLVKAIQNANIQYSLTRTARRFYVDLSNAMQIQTIKTFLPQDFTLQYIGGRVEVFKAYSDNVYVYDVNSLYPFVMSNFKYPATELRANELVINVYKGYTNLTKRFNEYIESIRKLVYEYITTDARLLKRLMDVRQKYFYVKARIKAIHPLFKPLEPIIKRYYPFSFTKNGRRVYTFDPNVEYFVEGYEVLFLAMFEFDVLELYYSDSDYLFCRNDIISLYNNRKQAKANNELATAMRLKSILVNLYGIFGLRQERESEETIDLANVDVLYERLQAFTKNDITNIKQLGTLTKISLTNNEQRTTIFKVNNVIKVSEKAKTFSKHMSAPTFATATTSHGRFWLLANIYYVVISKKGEVYYCDTDSIFTNTLLESSPELGEFKLERTLRKAYFLAPKTYIYVDDQNQTRIKAKGTGRALIRELILQTLKTPFSVIEKKALSPQRKTNKIPRQDGWLIYVEREIDYFIAYRDVIRKAMTEITDENVKKQLQTLYDESLDDEG